jgi:uncharacterized protein
MSDRGKRHTHTGASSMHVLAKPIGPLCNLDCKYCFYLEKEVLYPNTSHWAMQPGVLESFIAQYIDQEGEEVHFAWQGGEPTLLGVGFFRNVVALQKKHAKGKSIHNALQTNGVLLDDEWGEFLANSRFLVGVSIDGPEAQHDAYRVDKGGQPSFRRVMRGIEILQAYGVAFNTLTTVHRKNSSAPLAVYRFLRELGGGLTQFIPIVERISRQNTVDGLTLVSPSFHSPVQIAPWSVEPAQYGEFLCSIFDAWVRDDVGRHFVQLFEESLQMWSGIPSSLCIFREKCGSALAIEHNGDLYSCDHFVYPENLLGNIVEQSLHEIWRSSQQKAFGDAKLDALPQQCLQCDVRFACNGECPKHRFAVTKDGEPGLNYLCVAYKRFFRHIDPYMRFMADRLRLGQSPALVMGWIKERELQANFTTAERNDPCPCGSGRKFKRCCGAART